MHFSKLLFAPLLVAGAAAQSQIDGQKLAAAITSLTSTSGTLDTKISSSSDPVDAGQSITSGYKDIINDETKDISTFGFGSGDATGTVAADQESAVCQAYITFVQVSQGLLKSTIGKKETLASTPFAQPIAAVLRTYEGATDTFSKGVVGSVKSCASDLKSQEKTLEDLIAKAVTTYDS